MAILTFENLVINFHSQEITDNGLHRKLDPKAFSTLHHLWQNEHRVVPTSELIKEVWGNRSTSNDVVISAIGRIRKLFNEAGIDQEVIQTVHCIGYRFTLVPEGDSQIVHAKPDRHKNFNYLLIGIITLFTAFIADHWLRTHHFKDSLAEPFVGQRKVSMLNENEKVTEIFFLRHADKQRDGTKNPPLSTKGIARAKKWKQVFQNIEFDEIYTTSLHRNIQTAEQMYGDSVENLIYYDALSFDIQSQLKHFYGKKVLILGHANTIPAMLIQLDASSKHKPISHDNYHLITQVIISPNGTTSTNSFYLDFSLDQLSKQTPC